MYDLIHSSVTLLPRCSAILHVKIIQKFFDKIFIVLKSFQIHKFLTLGIHLIVLVSIHTHTQTYKIS